MDDREDLPIHASLWERGLALEKRREAGARSREEARKARASTGHVNGRSAELVRAMRVRSLVQTYRTLLASVEYARLPDGLDYDEVWAEDGVVLYLYRSRSWEFKDATNIERQIYTCLSCLHKRGGI